MNNQTNFMQMFQQFRANPMQMILQSRMNVPSGVNDPNQILNHLLKTGQITQEQINAAYQMMQRFK